MNSLADDYLLLSAYIPTPIVLAQVIDHTCILWNNQCVNDKGTCLEYQSDNFHYIIFGSSGAIKIVSCVVLLVFSAYVHKNYILKRKYQNQVALRHDPSSILTSRQKYIINNHVASTASTPVADCGGWTSDDIERASSLHALNSHRKRLERMRLRKREDSAASSTDDSMSVVLRSHSILEESFVSVSRSQTPDFFTDLNQVRSQAQTPAGLLDEPKKETVQLSAFSKPENTTALKNRKSTSNL
jgi:hypothetical protein